MSDIFREVEEELQRQKLKQFWNRYGMLIVGVAVLIVVATLAYKGWEAYQVSTAADRGDRFIAALEMSDQGDLEGARTAFEELISDSGSGYSLLSRFRAASDMAAGTNPAGGLAGFDAIAADTGVDAFLRDVARIRAGYVAVDLEDFDAVSDRVSDLAVSGSPLRFSAHEILGLAAWKSGNLSVASARFESLREDVQTPPDLRQRVEVMLALVRSRLEQDGEPDAAAQTQ
ncbi:MAG: tetratricopeptide repeat protein [Pseudomonadota bacterium]